MQNTHYIPIDIVDIQIGRRRGHDGAAGHRVPVALCVDRRHAGDDSQQPKQKQETIPGGD